MEEKIQCLCMYWEAPRLPHRLLVQCTCAVQTISEAVKRAIVDRVDWVVLYPSKEGSRSSQDMKKMYSTSTRHVRVSIFVQIMLTSTLF